MFELLYVVVGSGHNESTPDLHISDLAQDPVNASENPRKRTRVTKSQNSKRVVAKGKVNASRSVDDSQPLQVIENMALPGARDLSISENS